MLIVLSLDCHCHPKKRKLFEDTDPQLDRFNVGIMRVLKKNPGEEDVKLGYEISFDRPSTMTELELQQTLRIRQQLNPSGSNALIVRFEGASTPQEGEADEEAQSQAKASKLEMRRVLNANVEVPAPTTLSDAIDVATLQKENALLRIALQKATGSEDQMQCSPPKKGTFGALQQQLDLARRIEPRPHGEQRDVERHPLREPKSVDKDGLAQGFSVPLDAHLRQVDGAGGRKRVDVTFNVQRRSVIIGVFDAPPDDEEDAGMDEHSQA